MLSPRFFYVTAAFALLLVLAAVFGYFEDSADDGVSGMANLSEARDEAALSTGTNFETPLLPEDGSNKKTAADSSAHNAQPVERSVEAALGDDPDARARAIGALALAPKAQALPVLQKVLNAGVDADRQFALSSLHTLALREGDADGEIQNVLRLAIYDGDDTIASGAQIVLEEIERDALRMARVHR